MPARIECVLNAAMGVFAGVAAARTVTSQGTNGHVLTKGHLCLRSSRANNSMAAHWLACLSSHMFVLPAQILHALHVLLTRASKRCIAAPQQLSAALWQQHVRGA